MEELSIMDGLTQAYNRNYLKYKLEEKRKLLKYPFTVIMSDCNYLKTVWSRVWRYFASSGGKYFKRDISRGLPSDKNGWR